MRASNSLKLIGLILLAVFTSTTTSSLVAQSRQSPRRSTAVALATTTTPEGRTVTTASGDGSQQAAAPIGVRQEPVARFKLEHFDMAVSGRQVGVSVSASIKETRPNIGNVWSIRVYDGTPAMGLLSEHHYADQIFETNAIANTAPTFSDKVTLNPGSYRVEVVLYALPNSDVSILADETNAKSFRVLAHSKLVTVN